MTPEAQRIAIAEACGWTCIERINRFSYGGLRGVDPTGESKIIPSYLTDLNVCHEFEKVLSTSPEYMQQHAFNNYAYLLIEMCKHQCNAVSATAAQRCEAFLKTIDKWTND